MTKSKRGFAAMNPDKQREIASAGGKASHANGKGHEWGREEARAAALKAVALRKNKKVVPEATTEAPKPDAA